MAKQEFIFIDTETTGCRPTVDRIIEIGLLHVIDGRVESSWSHLINPDMSIPAPIQRLTGIDNNMLITAPRFSEIADELAELLYGKIFVAHNARFDYAFIKNEMKRCGITLQLKTLCTVKLSRDLFPNTKGHSLDALCERFALIATERHRALADAELLVQFYKRLQQQFSPSLLTAAIKNAIKQPALPQHLSLDDINAIPNLPGVYYFYGKDQSLLYIGKSVTLRDRVLSHFTQDHTSTKELQLSQQVHQVTWTTTAGELGALLQEAHLIKTQLPIFNRRLRRHSDLYTLLLKPNREGYLRLQITPFKTISSNELPDTYGIFRQKRKAEETIRELCREHHFCLKVMELEKRHGACFYKQIGKCTGACIGNIPMHEYNQQLLATISDQRYRDWPYKGKIAIKETCPITGKHEYHLLDQWCYLGTLTTLEQLSLYNEKPQLDADIYQILTAYLLDKKPSIDIIPLCSDIG